MLTISGVKLTYHNTFVAVSLVNTLRVMLTPPINAHPVKLLSDFSAALRRVEALLQLQDEGTLSIHKQLNITFGGDENMSSQFSFFGIPTKTLGTSEEASVSPPPRVVLQDVTCSWKNTSTTVATLKNVSLSLSTPDLVLVTGPVGCGKSSLLLAILQELPPSRGTVSCEGSIAYVSQKPWIFSGTIRDNILLGKDMCTERYAHAIDVCQLGEDVAKWPSGDLTMIGERGVLLSGGQRARVALARAVYADADVYLLDDPLSAVDAKVGSEIFGRCICGTLSRKARILVTHKLEFLSHADDIVLMKDGAISQRGTFYNLQSSGLKLEVLNGNNVKPMTKDSSVDQRKRFPKEITVTGNHGLETEEEDRMMGSVSSALYAKYFRAGLGYAWLLMLAVLFCCVQGMSVTPKKCNS